jgi:hypothetical protein
MTPERMVRLFGPQVEQTKAKYCDIVVAKVRVPKGTFSDKRIKFNGKPVHSNFHR